MLYVNGKERITDCPAVNTGQWYHVGVSWRSWDGDWRVYINGKPSDGGKGLSVGSSIPGRALLRRDREAGSAPLNPGLERAVCGKGLLRMKSNLEILFHFSVAMTVYQLSTVSDSRNRLIGLNVFKWHLVMGMVTVLVHW